MQVKPAACSHPAIMVRLTDMMYYIGSVYKNAKIFIFFFVIEADELKAAGEKSLLVVRQK